MKINTRSSLLGIICVSIVLKLSLSEDISADGVNFTYEENVKRHDEIVRQSEELFQGYYGNKGFEFQYEKVPSEWISYSVSEGSFEQQQKFRPENILDVAMEIGKRVVPPRVSNDDLARVSKTPILTDDECREIIEDCENSSYGWGRSGARYGTSAERIGDIIQLQNLPKSYSLVNFQLLPRLFPAIAKTFTSMNIHPENLRLFSSRIVKYDESKGRVELGFHRDGRLFTANIALNDIDEYEGGGVYLEGLKDFMESPIKLEKGQVLLHPGNVRHAGAPITKGVRYVLICFIVDTTVIAHEAYCTERMDKDMNKVRSIPKHIEGYEQHKEELLASATKHCKDGFRFANITSMDCNFQI